MSSCTLFNEQSPECRHMIWIRKTKWTSECGLSPWRRRFTFPIRDLKAWFPYDLQPCATRSPIGLHHVAEIWNICLRHRRWSAAHGLDDRESWIYNCSSTFPTITTLPTKTNFNGNVCLKWTVSYRRQTVVRLQTWSKCAPFSLCFAEN